MNDVKDLIDDARAFADRDNGMNLQGRVRELADALEAQQARISEFEEFVQRANRNVSNTLAAYAEREQEYSAVIEKVRTIPRNQLSHPLLDDDEVVTLINADALDAILDEAPYDLQRFHDARVWDDAVKAVERIHPRCTDECEMCAELDDWLRILNDENPYREKPGADQ